MIFCHTNDYHNDLKPCLHFNLAVACNEFFYWLAFHSISCNRPSHVQTQQKGVLELAIHGHATSSEESLPVLLAFFGFSNVSAVCFLEIVSVLNCPKVKFLIRIFTHVSVKLKAWTRFSYLALSWVFHPQPRITGEKPLSRNQLKMAWYWIRSNFWSLPVA